MLNRNGEKKTPYLILDLGGIAFSISHLNMRLALGFHGYPLRLKTFPVFLVY